MAAFYVPVISVADGVRIMDVLADYDAFQLEHRVKGDYSNVGGLEVYYLSTVLGEPGWWESWYDGETGDDDPRAWLAARQAAQAGQGEGCWTA